MARKSKKSTGISINLSEVSTGSKTLPEGRYQVKVAEVEVKQSQSGNDFVAFTFEVVEGKNKKAKVFHNCSLQPQALFNLKTVLEALQYEIPSGEFELELEELVDLECIVEIEHETFEGKKKARAIDFDTVGDSDDEDEDDEDEDEEEDDEDEDEDDNEEDEEVDYEELSLKELKALAKERGIKIPKKADEDDIIELLEEYDEEEDGEDDEEEEDEIDYEELSLKELKALAKERGIKVKKGMDEEDIIELLEEDDEE